MLRNAAAIAGQALSRGLAGQASSAAYTGLVELRQYTMKPEGTKVRNRARDQPLGRSMRRALVLTLPSTADPPTADPRRFARPCRPPHSTTLPQEFMRLTNDKAELRKSLLPFLGCDHGRCGVHVAAAGAVAHPMPATLMPQRWHACTTPKHRLIPAAPNCRPLNSMQDVHL